MTAPSGEASSWWLKGQATAASARSGRSAWSAATGPHASPAARRPGSASRPARRFPRRHGFSEAERAFVISALRSPRAAITTTSAGRLFDAWASLLGIAHSLRLRGRGGHAARGTGRSGRAAGLRGHRSSRRAPRTVNRFFRIDWRPWVLETCRLLAAGWPTATLAAMFHNSLASGSLEMARRAGLNTVVLGGGCFQNRLLAERVTQVALCVTASACCCRPRPAGRRRPGGRADLGGRCVSRSSVKRGHTHVPGYSW